MLLRLGDWEVAGFSPEIARVTPDGTVVTQPLAGTRALDGSPLFDAARCDELYRDATEVFEHALSVHLAATEMSTVCARANRPPPTPVRGLPSYRCRWPARQRLSAGRRPRPERVEPVAHASLVGPMRLVRGRGRCSCAGPARHRRVEAHGDRLRGSHSRLLRRWHGGKRPGYEAQPRRRSDQYGFRGAATPSCGARPPTPPCDPARLVTRTTRCGGGVKRASKSSSPP
ncbi:hypothetical protein GCM10012279_49700 [Micromonospora yangpuensis]|nr:hypothetical protein GCM10012279_49700 [Micromonospora yangpuensis]